MRHFLVVSGGEIDDGFTVRRWMSFARIFGSLRIPGWNFFIEQGDARM